MRTIASARFKRKIIASCHKLYLETAYCYSASHGLSREGVVGRLWKVVRTILVNLDTEEALNPKPQRLRRHAP